MVVSLHIVKETMLVRLILFDQARFALRAKRLNSLFIKLQKLLFSQLLLHFEVIRLLINVVLVFKSSGSHAV